MNLGVMLVGRKSGVLMVERTAGDKQRDNLRGGSRNAEERGQNETAGQWLTMGETNNVLILSPRLGTI